MPNALTGHLEWHDALMGYTVGDARDLSLSTPRQRAPYAALRWSSIRVLPGPKGIDRHVPLTITVIYEAHVKGLTALHPEAGRRQGRFLALASDPMLDHLVARRHRDGAAAGSRLPE